MAASATFALKAGVWFRRGRLLMVSPDSWGTACPPSGRNSTYRPVQISGTGSLHTLPFGAIATVKGETLRHLFRSARAAQSVTGHYVSYPECPTISSSNEALTYTPA